MDNVAIKNGLILGVIWIIYNLLLYLVNPTMLGGWQVHLIFLAAVFLMWKSAVGERQINEGILSFGEGFKASLLTILIGLLIGLLFKHILMSVIDPNLPDLLKENAIEQIESVGEAFSMSDDQLEEMVEAIEEQDMTPTIVNTLGGFLMLVLIPYLPTALIIGAIAKKEEAMFT